MIPFSKEKVASDEKDFHVHAFPEFMTHVRKSSDRMLFYELRRYFDLLFFISDTLKSSSNIAVAGGVDWVKWLQRRFSIEEEFVLSEAKRRGLPNYTGDLWRLDRELPISLSHHAWELSQERDDECAIIYEWNLMIS